jgi:uncharacterized protein YdhG (YjbR/CyaY superfamily)
MIKPTDTQSYINTFDGDVKLKLEQIREVIRKAAPQSQEVISYGMPAFKQHGVLVYFAANKNHVGFYPTAAPIVVFADELAEYTTSKGAIQFPFNKPLPVRLITKIVKYRLAQDLEIQALKKKK